MIQIAEDTISSLKRQLVKKEEKLQKYREMIQDLRQEIALLKEMEDKAASKRTSEINQQADGNLQRLRKKPDTVATHCIEG